jgi:DNA mismatch repair protein MutS2
MIRVLRFCAKILVLLAVFLLQDSGAFVKVGKLFHPRQNAAEQKTAFAPLLLSTAKFDDINGKPAAARAGSDGYSVFRQPAQWDLDRDPVFAVPESLKDDHDQGNAQSLEEWWLNRKAASSSNIFTKSTNDRITVTSSNFNAQQSKNPLDKFSLGIESEEENLDLFQRSLNTLDFPRILKALYNECTTVPGKRIVQKSFSISNWKAVSTRSDGRIPSNTSSHIAFQSLVADSFEGTQERYSALREMKWLLEGGNGTARIDDTISYKNRYGYSESLYYQSPPFMHGNGFNFERILDLAVTQSKVLDGADIIDVIEMMDSLDNVRLWGDSLDSIKEFSFTQLPAITNCIHVNATLQDLLRHALDKDGRLSSDAFPNIGRLRAEVRALKSDIMGALDSLLGSPEVKSKLTLESGGPLFSEVQGGRLVIPVDRKYASAIGIVHDTSRSGKTVYVEPNEIIGSTNELRQTESELRAEEIRVWRQLTEQIVANQGSLEVSVAAIGQLDLVVARLNFGQKISGTIPLVQDEGIISLKNAQHPVLLLRGIENVVGSDVTLGFNGNRGLVLTGPNAGGKTVILKLLGLMALMARSGIPVPASASKVDTKSALFYEPRIDFFNPVLADIGDIQSVGGDLSTFSGHMLVCREVLLNSGRNALVLMDELGSGTDPNQGVAIAQALLEAVVDAGARVAITTHYSELKQLPASDDRFSVAGMQFVNGRPTYKLLPGTVGESFALSVAERIGLPSSVINRANELMNNETRQMGDLIREMEDQKLIVDLQMEAMQQKEKEMEAMEQEMKEKMIRLENQQLNVRREEARKFAKLLEEKESILEDILVKLKSDPSCRIVAKSWDDIKFAKRDALNEAENVPSIVARKMQAIAAMEETTADLIPIAEMRDKPILKGGEKVIICERGPMFGREAEVIKALDSRVEVKVNNINVSFKLTQIALAPHHKPPPPRMGETRQLSSRAKAIEQALTFEGKIKANRPDSSNNGNTSTSGKIAMRTESNTVDVRGCNLVDAQEKVRDKFSTCLMNGRSVVYILHGHGTGGVLKSKIRAWLRSEKLVKSFGPADRSDGGDAFTRVDL